MFLTSGAQRPGIIRKGYIWVLILFLHLFDFKCMSFNVYQRMCLICKIPEHVPNSSCAPAHQRQQHCGYVWILLRSPDWGEFRPNPWSHWSQVLESDIWSQRIPVCTEQNSHDMRHLPLLWAKWQLGGQPGGRGGPRKLIQLFYLLESYGKDLYFLTVYTF